MWRFFGKPSRSTNGAEFRINRWAEPQVYQPNPFDKTNTKPQDVKQVWFAGVHADIGGGQTGTESGPAQHTLGWVRYGGGRRGLANNRPMSNQLLLWNNPKRRPPTPT